MGRGIDPPPSPFSDFPLATLPFLPRERRSLAFWSPRYGARERATSCGAPSAHFLPLRSVSPRHNEPIAMLEAIKGLSRHKRPPPRTRREIDRHAEQARVSAGRGSPPFIPRPLDRFSAWRCSEGVGTKGVPNPAPSGRFDRASGGSNKGHDEERKATRNARHCTMIPLHNYRLIPL
jgi:hypothetical protein